MKTQLQLPPLIKLGLIRSHISDWCFSLLCGDYGVDQLDAAAQGNKVTPTLNSLEDMIWDMASDMLFSYL